MVEKKNAAPTPKTEEQQETDGPMKMGEGQGGRNQQVCKKCAGLCGAGDAYCRHCGNRLFLYISEMPEVERDPIIAGIERLIDRYLVADLSQDRGKPQ